MELNRQTVVEVQNNLNRLDLAVLGHLLAHCGKDAFGRRFAEQVLFAMSREFDAARMGYRESMNALSAIAT